MPAFEYTIHDAAGIVRRDVIQAPSKDDAIAQLQAMSFEVFSIHLYRPDLATRVLGVMERRDNKALLLFTRQFATMLRAGLPVLRCLVTLGRQTESHRLRLVLNVLRGSVESGLPLSKAMAEFPDLFSHLYVSMVKVGESAGVLEDTLDKLATFLEKDFVLRRKVQQALTYPCFVLAIAIGVVWALVTFLIPRFIQIFYQSGMNMSHLPWTTRTMMVLATNLGQPAVIAGIVAGLIALTWLLRRIHATQRGRYFFDLLKINVPLLGNLCRQVALARLCRTFGTLVASGIHILQALEIVGASSGNLVIERSLDNVRIAVHGGEQLSDHLARCALFPPMVIQMVSVGETTGKLDVMLHKMADFYDTEVEYMLGSLTALVEPIMIVGVGGVVLFIVLSVFLPIIAMVQFNSL